MGRLEGPVKLNPDGLPIDRPLGRSNIAFRFGVSRSEKLRACGDLRHILTNEACVISAPIQLVSWGHIGQLDRLLCTCHLPWNLFIADHEAAYKKPPLHLSDQCSAIIPLRHPVSGDWFGFRARTIMFGPAAAVPHYICFARAIALLVNQVLGIPLVSYFDDFAALVPAAISLVSLRTFRRFCKLLGIALKSGKSEVGHAVTFLCLKGSSPPEDPNSRLWISLPSDKASKRADSIREII